MASMLTALLVMALAAVLVSGCANEQKILDSNKARVTQLLVQKTQLREFLENGLYGLNANVIIADYYVERRPDAVIYANGHLIFPKGYSRDWYGFVRENESTIIAIFQMFKCEKIQLSLPDNTGSTGPKKVLGIGFDNIKIDDERYHAQFLSYSKDATAPGTSSDVEIFKDWYYSTPGYT